jgi:hypothetical protein
VPEQFPRYQRTTAPDFDGAGELAATYVYQLPYFLKIKRRRPLMRQESPRFVA